MSMSSKTDRGSTMRKHREFSPSSEYLQAEHIYKQAVLRYERAKTRHEEAIAAYAFTRMRQMEYAEEAFMHRDPLHSLRHDA